MGLFSNYFKGFWHLAVFLISLLLLSIVNVKAEEKQCQAGFKVRPGSPVNLKIRFPMPSDKCFRGLYGNKDCNVMLSCKIDIPKSDDCKEHYVKVTDGSSGAKSFCGKTEFNKIRATEGLRHLFLVIQSGSGSESDPSVPITCVAECAKDGEGEKLEAGTVERKTDLRCVCGLQNKDDRIVGGESAAVNEFPWQAAIVYPRTRSPMCGASIINNQFILSAAHCFWYGSKQPKDIEVLLRATLLDMTKTKYAKDVELGKQGSIRSPGYNLSRKTDKDERTLRFKVVEIINHPMFTQEYDYDYALLKLDKKIDLGDADAPTPICLPAANTYDAELADWAGKNLTVTGWGLADENAGGTTRSLQKLNVPYISYEDCKNYNKDLWTNRMICAGYEEGKMDACTGDSGGPLSRQLESKQHRQVGIVSWGIGCARSRKPGFYSRVTEMMQWIHLHTTEHDSKWCQESK